MQLQELDGKKFTGSLVLLANSEFSEVMSGYQMWIEDGRVGKLADYLIEKGLVSEEDIKRTVVCLWASIRSFFSQGYYTSYEKYFNRLNLLVDLFNSRENLENLIPEPRDYLLTELFKRLTNGQDMTGFFKTLIEAKATQGEVDSVLNNIIGKESINLIRDGFRKSSDQILRQFGESMGLPMIEKLKKNPYENIPIIT